VSAGQWRPDVVGEDGRVPRDRPDWVGSDSWSVRGREGEGLDKLVAEMKRLLATARKDVRGSIYEEIRWWAMTRWDGHTDRVSEAEANLMDAWGKGESGSDSGELRTYRRLKYATKLLQDLACRGGGKQPGGGQEGVREGAMAQMAGRV